MAGNTSPPGVSVLTRAVALLGAFDEQHRRRTLTELAGQSGLALTTAHRLVAELTSHQLLARTASGDYVIGQRLWSLGLLAPMQTGLREVASPFLHDLYAATLATVHLAVPDGAEVLYIDRLAGQRSVPIVSNIGSRLPMHSTGVGKVLCAHASEDVQLQVLSSLKRITPFTVTQPVRLQRQLAKVRADDYATTEEEMTLGACSVAVPVRGPDQRVVAALGIVVPSLRGHRQRLVAALHVAAHGIGRSLPSSPWRC